MKLVRIASADGPQWGAIEADAVRLLRGDPQQGFTPTAKTRAFDPQLLLAPVQPSKIVALAASYPKHAAEMGHTVAPEPRLFLKPPSSVIGPNEPIRIPPHTTRVDPEGELALVIGQRLCRASPERALAGVFGVTCLNDVTCRDFQRADRIFGRAKGFDTFCPVGPWVVTGLDASDLALCTRVNGEARASGRTSDLLFELGALLSFVSGVMTLLPGDVVTTGTPPGVAPVVAGDVVEVEIEGIGVLRNPVLNRVDRP